VQRLYNKAGHYFNRFVNKKRTYRKVLSLNWHDILACILNS
jgi:hypothetical protein